MAHENCGPSRRSMIRSLAAGSLLFPGIVQQLLAAEAGGGAAGSAGGSIDANPLAPRAGHFPAKAKRVIFLYMSGGVSHIDSFDPKPRLSVEAGKLSPAGKPYLRPLWDFKPG